MNLLEPRRTDIEERRKILLILFLLRGKTDNSVMINYPEKVARILRSYSKIDLLKDWKVTEMYHVAGGQMSFLFLPAL